MAAVKRFAKEQRDVAAHLLRVKDMTDDQVRESFCALWEPLELGSFSGRSEYAIVLHGIPRLVAIFRPGIWRQCEIVQNSSHE